MTKAKEARNQSQLKRGRQAREDQFRDRLLQTVGNAEIALKHPAHIAEELDGEGIVEPQCLAHRLAFGERGFLSDHGCDRVADKTEQPRRTPAPRRA